jgi:hypothetical protein
MAFEITNWNIAENRAWYARIADLGEDGIQIELYLTLADAQARANLQAQGETTGYGADVEVILINEDSATVPVTLFREDYEWHLLVDGASGDDTVIFKIKEFVELDEISHPIYRNSALIEARAAAEIDAHTHAAIVRDITLGTHAPTMEPGDVVTLTSDRRGLDDMGQVFERTITGTVNSLTDAIEVRKFLELKR